MNRLSTRARRVAPLLGAGALAGVATLGLHLRDPHVEGSWGFCPSALLGVACTFCGSLRAVNLLTHGDLLGAASSNLVLVILAPMVMVLWARAVTRAWRGRTPLLPQRIPAVWGWTVLALLTVFTVLRNLDAGSWLAPGA